MMQQKYGIYFLWSSLIAKILSIVENTLDKSITVEEAVRKNVEYNTITTEENCIVICDSGFSQGDK